MAEEIDQHTKNMIVKLDGWSNILTGLGRQGKDKRTGYFANWNRMDWEQAEHIYACDDMAEKIVDAPVDEAFRKDPIFTQTALDGEFNKELWDYLNEIGFWPKYIEAAKWGRLYGGAFLLFGVQDGEDPDQEIKFDNISDVPWMNTLHRWDMNSVDIVHDVSSKYFRDPESYIFTRGALSGSELAGPRIHRSRAVRFEGAKLPERLYRSNNYFNDSVLNRVQNAIKNYNSSHDSLAVLMQDFSAGVFKMKNLAQLVGAGQDAAVAKRLQLIDLKRSLVKSVVVDADEDFERKSTPLNGIKDALQKIDDRLVAASRMPHTLLLGEGSTGSLSGAGESEQEQWDDYIKGLQKTDFKPPLLECLRIILSNKANPITKGVVPEGFDITFPPLKEPSPKEKGEVYKVTAEGDAVYIQNGVLDPDEVAISRFSDDEFNQNTQIDVKIREKSLKEGPEEPDMEDGLPDPNDPKDPKADPKADEIVAFHVHSVDEQYNTGGAIYQNDGKHIHTYFLDEVLHQTTPEEDTEGHVHKFMHKKDGTTGKKQASEGIETRKDEFVDHHNHSISERESTGGAVFQNDGRHIHTYFFDGVEHQTSPGEDTEGHVHKFMHKKDGSTGAKHLTGSIETRKDAQPRSKDGKFSFGAGGGSKSGGKSGSGGGGGGGGGEGASESSAEAGKKFKSADKKVESAGNKFDKNPTKANREGLETAITARSKAKEAHIKSQISDVKVQMKQSSVSGLEGKLKAAKQKRVALDVQIAASKKRTKALKAKLKASKAKSISRSDAFEEIDFKSIEVLLKELDDLILKAEKKVQESKQDAATRDHWHEWTKGIFTSGMLQKNDDTHTHTYWTNGVKHETNPAPTGVPHRHDLMHRKGETGKAEEFISEVRIDSIEKDGSMFVFKDDSGKKILGKFKSKKKAEDAKKVYEDEMASRAGKRGPELLPKDD